MEIVMEGWVFKDYLIVGLLLLNFYFIFLIVRQTPKINYHTLFYVFHSKQIELLKLKIEKMDYENKQWNVEIEEWEKKIERLEDELDDMKYDEFVKFNKNELDKVLLEK